MRIVVDGESDGFHLLGRCYQRNIRRREII